MNSLPSNNYGMYFTARGNNVTTLTISTSPWKERKGTRVPISPPRLLCLHWRPCCNCKNVKKSLLPSTNRPITTALPGVWTFKEGTSTFHLLMNNDLPAARPWLRWSWTITGFLLPMSHALVPRVNVRDDQFLRSSLAVIVIDFVICDGLGMTHNRTADCVDPILLFLYDQNILVVTTRHGLTDVNDHGTMNST